MGLAVTIADSRNVTQPPDRLTENPTAQFNVGEPPQDETVEANKRLKVELGSLIARLEGALLKFKEKKSKLRQHVSLIGPDV